MSNDTPQSESVDSARPSWAAHELAALGLTVGLAVWVVAQWGAAVQPQRDTERDENRAQALTDLRAADEEALNSFGVVDEENKLYRIPILYAMTNVAVVYKKEGASSVIADRKPTPLQLGKKLFHGTKACFTCHQTDPKKPALLEIQYKAPKFIGEFWDTEREVLDGVGGPVIKVTLDEAYFKESVKTPEAKLVKGALLPMPPLAPPLTKNEIEALMIYVKSLSKQMEEK